MKIKNILQFLDFTKDISWYFIACAAIFILAFGWIANVFQVIAMANNPITVLFILKIIGIFAIPLGIILGWIGLF